MDNDRVVLSLQERVWGSETSYWLWVEKVKASIHGLTKQTQAKLCIIT